MKTQTTEKIGARRDSRTDQYVPTVNGKDVSPTSFDRERALEIARQAAQPAATHTPESWYDKLINEGSAHEQGLVIAEVDGRNIAVVYDPKDTAMISAAPDLLAALRDVDCWLICPDTSRPALQEIGKKIRAAIARATS